MSRSAQGICVRDQITPVPAGQSLFDALRAIGADSFEALVDINGRLPHVRIDDTTLSVDTDAAIGVLKDRLRSERTVISALLVANDFSADDAAPHVEWAVRTVETARKLGVPVVRIDTLTANRALPLERVRDNFIGRVGEVLSQTSASGVDLGMENHGPISNDPRFLDDVLAAIPDPRFGMTLDTGNFYWWGHPLNKLYSLIDRYAGRTKHTHIKNINFPPEVRQKRREIGFEYKQYCCPVDEGNIDLKQVMASLHRAGYRRDWCIEDESMFKVPEHDRLNVLRREVQALRTIANQALES